MAVQNILPIKIALIVLAINLTLCSHAQDADTFTVKIKGNRLVNIDTIYLDIKPKQTVNKFTHVSSSDSGFSLPGIPVGEYWLKFLSDQFCVAPLSIVVCTKCDNQFKFFAVPKTAESNCDLFTMVEISPSYIGGEKKLVKDFERALSEKEKKTLKGVPDFILHFYLTKEKAFSDISFGPATLRPDVKEMIAKALASTDGWVPAMQNGVVVDAEVILHKQELLHK
jgi:hypothetical protein